MGDLEYLLPCERDRDLEYLRRERDPPRERDLERLWERERDLLYERLWLLDLLLE